MISKNIELFRSSGNIYYILRAIFESVQQGRSLEILYGIYSSLRYSPSKIVPCDPNVIQKLINNFKLCWYKDKQYWTREQLISIYGNSFLVKSLPSDFEGARSQTIVCLNGYLLIGEYGEGVQVSRIALITSTSCIINDFYTHYSSIRHIHSIYSQNLQEILITTGDSSKFLDMWRIDNQEIVFVKRIKCSLAGYTAITRINNTYYFGTDFSNRPNYIEKLNGDKYFFPLKAYKEWVLTFYTFSDRYIISVNRPVLSFEKSIAIFDTFNNEFVLCDNLKSILGEPDIR